MFVFKSLLSLTVVAGTLGAPLNKRIAQTIADSTQKWEQACLAAGGQQQCNPVSITAFSTLLAGAGPCEQQDAADQMIDLAKQLKNDPDMIRLTQIFAQQPRNSPNSVATPYCQQAPNNQELNGLFQCQFEGADQQNFAGGASLGDQGTIPFGLNAPLDPPGSCPANPGGPIADGSQLADITGNPGVGGAGANNGNGTGKGGNNNGNNNNTGNTNNGDRNGGANGSGGGNETNTGGNDGGAGNDGGNETDTGNGNNGADNGDNVDNSSAGNGNNTGNGAGNGAGNNGNNGGNGGNSFALSNGQKAQQQNAEFQQLNGNSSCQDGENACVNGQFAQCVGGQFTLVSCGASLQCNALPLVNSPGTSITCTTQADAEARIAATGATGGITGNN